MEVVCENARVAFVNKMVERVTALVDKRYHNEMIAIGSVAIIMNGYCTDRLPHDLDLCVSRRLFEILPQYGFIYAPRTDRTLLVSPDGLIEAAYDCLWFDYDEIDARSLTYHRGSDTIRYCTLSDVLAWKRSAHRKKDLVDLETLHLI